MGCSRRPNSPFVVWAACFLWLTSIFAISLSLVLFFCLGDILLLTGTDLVNAFVLLSGLIMMPTNVHMLYFIANCKKIDHRSKVTCCPLWFCIVWIVIVNVAGAIVCIHRLWCCEAIVKNYVNESMLHYRSVPEYKNFMDNMQWSLRCCGLNSYKDWFSLDWYDKIRDYEWDPSVNERNAKQDVSKTDSVPLSCCKSGSCISNFLSELGTYSINTGGCGRVMYRVILMSMIGHLIFFLLVIVLEVLILRFIFKKESLQAEDVRGEAGYHMQACVQDIMRARDNFDVSSSYQMHPDDSEDDGESNKAFREQNNQDLIKK